MAVAVCPYPPILVPELAAGAAGELEELRQACDAAVAEMLAQGPDVVCVLCEEDSSRSYSSADSGSLDGFGVDLRVTLGPVSCGGQPILPLPLTIGAWLVRRAGFTGERQGFGMGINTPVDDSASQLAELAGRVAVLVMAGGSACRIPEAPGGFDPGAAAFDAALVAALGAADPAALAAMDPAVAAVLHADGRVFQLLGVLAGQATWQSRVLCDIAPYGVEYAVAVWTRA